MELNTIIFTQRRVKITLVAPFGWNGLAVPKSQNILIFLKCIKNIQALNTFNFDLFLISWVTAEKQGAFLLFCND